MVEFLEVIDNFNNYEWSTNCFKKKLNSSMTPSFKIEHHK